MDTCLFCDEPATILCDEPIAMVAGGVALDKYKRPYKVSVSTMSTAGYRSRMHSRSRRSAIRSSRITPSSSRA